MLVATCDYGNGALGQIACGLRASRNNTLQIVGEEGVIEVGEAFTPGPEAHPVVKLWRGLREVQLSEFPIDPVNHYRLQVEGFDRLISQGHGAGPEQPLVETLDNMRTITALLQSAREGRPVEV